MSGSSMLFSIARRERPGAVLGVVALLDQELLGLVGQDQLQAVVLEPLADLRQLDVDDLLQVVAGQAAEDDDVVEAVEELGPEVPLDRAFSRSFIFS